MKPESYVTALVDAFEALSISYMLVGSLATNQYAVPRSTEDADFVVETTAAQLRELTARIGPPFRLDPQMTFERITATRRRILRIDGSSYVVELFGLSEDPHDQERFRRRRRSQFFGCPIWIPTAEDVVITKLRWALTGSRAKDQDDARNVLAIQGPYLDQLYLRHWCNEHGTLTLLDEILAKMPPE